MRIERVRLADAVPMSFDETYLPLEIGRKIVRNDLRVMPIFTLLEDKYGIPLTEAEYNLEAAAASAQVAEALEVPEGSPIFRIERTSFTTMANRSTMRCSPTAVISSGSSLAWRAGQRQKPLNPKRRLPCAKR